MRKTALIMAGGRGERFWPRSRRSMPKQFISLTDDGKTMIQLTVERINPIVEYENIFIATSEEYRQIVREQLPMIPEENILCEPVGRNTAPCIGLGAAVIQNRYGDSIMLVLPSDHMIKYNQMYRTVVTDACEIAAHDDNLVTIGITPDYPETGYGYIKFDSAVTNGRAFAVDRFVEKPDLETAKEYLRTEEYLWNSGMFIWKTSSILSNFEKFLPDMYVGLQAISSAIGTPSFKSTLEKEFTSFEKISIDYGIMEKAKDIFIVPGTFGWDDVGSWLAVERIKKTNELGNVVSGNVISIDSKNCIIEGSDKLIAMVGIEDTVVVDTQDALLICDKAHTNDIRKVLDNLRICNRNEYI